MTTSFLFQQSILILLIIFLIVIIRYLNMDIFSPLVLNIAPWIISLSIGVFTHDIYYPIQIDTLLVLLIWIFFSSLAMFIVMPSQVLRNNFAISSISIKFNYIYILFIVCIVAIIQMKSAIGGASNIALALRTAAVDKTGSGTSIGFIFRAQPIMLVLLFYEYLDPVRHKFRIFLLFLYQIIFVIATMSKLSILVPIIGLLILKERKYGINISKLIFIFLFVIIIFGLLQIIRDSSTNVNFNIVDVLSIYTYSPIVAFNEALHSNNISSLLFGEHMFRFFYTLIDVASGKGKTVALSGPDGWYSVPFPTNVLTTLCPVFSDFGYLGIVIFGMCYGVFFAYLYKKSRNDVRFLVIYASLAYILFLQFFDEILFKNFSGNIQIIIWSFVIYKLATYDSITIKRY